MKKQITVVMAAILMALSAVPFAASAAEAEPAEPASYTEDSFDDQSYVMISIQSMPDKREYQIGEELDLTGCEAMASGKEKNGPCWDTFKQSVENEYFFKLDTSEFDSSKPGTYQIYVSTAGRQKATTSFEVTVLSDVQEKTDSFDKKSGKAPAVSGDINGDGTADILDVNMVNKYIIGAAELSPEELLAADMNHDGIVDATDALNILKAALA
jgi:hypothetical protein